MKANRIALAVIVAAVGLAINYLRFSGRIDRLFKGVSIGTDLILLLAILALLFIAQKAIQKKARRNRSPEDKGNL